MDDGVRIVVFNTDGIVLRWSLVVPLNILLVILTGEYHIFPLLILIFLQAVGYEAETYKRYLVRTAE